MSGQDPTWLVWGLVAFLGLCPVFPLAGAGAFCSPPSSGPLGALDHIGALSLALAALPAPAWSTPGARGRDSGRSALASTARALVPVHWGE